VGLNRSQNNLTTALGLPQSAVVILVQPAKIPDIEIDPAKALGEALQNRSDAVNFELQKLQADRNVRQAKSDNSLTATLSASMGYNQQAPLLNDAYNNLLEQKQFSLNFSVPIFKWGAGSSTVDAAIADQKRIQVLIDQQRFDFSRKSCIRRHISICSVNRFSLPRNRIRLLSDGSTWQRSVLDRQDRYPQSLPRAE